MIRFVDVPKSLFYFRDYLCEPLATRTVVQKRRFAKELSKASTNLISPETSMPHAYMHAAYNWKGAVFVVDARGINFRPHDNPRMEIQVVGSYLEFESQVVRAT